MLFRSLTAVICLKLISGFSRHPLGMAFPILALTGLLGTRLIEGERSELLVYAASCAYILGIVSTGVYGLMA